MPATSKKQAAFMRAVAAGDLKAPGLSKAQAREFVAGHPTATLPTRAKPKKKTARSK